MLVLSRKTDETVILEMDETALTTLLETVRETKQPVNARITVVTLRGSAVRLGIAAPEAIKIIREEIQHTEKISHGTNTRGTR